MLWCSTRHDITDRAWIPNHFVPLVPLVAVSEPESEDSEESEEEDHEEANMQQCYVE